MLDPPARKASLREQRADANHLIRIFGFGWADHHLIDQRDRNS